MKEKERCSWANQSPLEQEYHDNQWGVPVYDDETLFEMLVLESMQAGLSWHLILTKRENFRTAFDEFDPVRIANYGQEKIDSLLLDSGIIRNKLKIAATISNAQVFLEMKREYREFSHYIWSFVDNKPIVNRNQSIEEVPAKPLYPR